MEDQLISYQTAKLAKEKGFNEFDTNNNMVFCEIKDSIFYRKPVQNKHGDMYNADYLYRAPTQSLLQRWLREKHGIHVEVRPTLINNKWYIQARRIESSNDDIITGLFSSFGIGSNNKSLLHWDTYEQGMEAVLQFVLRLKVEPITETFIKEFYH